MAPLTLTVLLIEDDEIDRRIVERALAHPGAQVRFELETAEELGEGLTRLDRGDIDVVLLDLNLPDASGLDTVRGCLRRSPNTPVVVLTGASGGEFGADAVRAGAQDYLDKVDVDPRLLQRVLRYAVERQAAANEARRHNALWSILVRSLRRAGESTPLQKRDPNAFGEVAKIYGVMLRQGPNALPGSPAHDKAIAELARRITSNGGRVGDILDMHLAAIGRQNEDDQLTPERGRLLILEIMGSVLSRYREIAQLARADRTARPAS